MKRRTILVLVAIPILLCGLFALLMGLWTGRLSTHGERVHAARRMGRLAPIPPGADDVRSRASGNPFTRSFHVCFTAAPDEIEQFLTSSPGLEGAVPGPYRPVVELGHFPWLDAQGTIDLKHYKIPPDGTGHGWGEIVIEVQDGVVHIYVAWS